MTSSICIDSSVAELNLQEYAILPGGAPSRVTLYRSWWPSDRLISSETQTASLAGQNTYEALQSLSGLFTFKDYVQIVNFLGQNPDLVPLLIDCYIHAFRCFTSPQLILELFPDREGSSSPELFVLIPTSQGVKEARERLKRFDHDWWIEASAAAVGRLNIDVEYI